MPYTSSNASMRGRDTINARLAECYVTIDNQRFNFMQIVDFEAKVEKNKTTVPRLGAIMMGHKAVGMEGTFSGTAHYVTSVLRELVKKFKDTGVDTYFEIQVSNEDPSSATGRQTIIFYDCNMDNSILAKFDASGDYLDEDIAGTFEDFSIPEKFTELDGFLA